MAGKQWKLFEVGDRIKRLCPANAQTKTSLLTLVEEEGVTFAAVLEEEDAHLIAAAPALLEALQLIILGYGMTFQDAALRNLARDAIAKATGSEV